MTKTLNEMILTVFHLNRGLWLTNRQINYELNVNCILQESISPIQLREIIKNLRFGGHPIIAGPKGYKLSDNPQELKDYITSRKLELESELNILRKMEGKW